MLKQGMKYGAALIALFIGASHASEMGQLFTAGAAGGTQFVKGLQGR